LEQVESATGFSAKLVSDSGTEYLLNGEMTVGRVEECDITIEDPGVSRAHAVIRVEGEQVTVEDLGSANGSRINDRRAKGQAVLADGDTFSCENHHFRVEITGAKSVAPPANDDAIGESIPADDDATLVGGYSPPAAEAAPGVAPKTAASTDAFNLPGSWVEGEDDGEHTRIVIPGAADAAGVKPLHARESDEAHVQVVVDGTGSDLFELSVAGGSEPDVWEIGRNNKCEVSLAEPTVSDRHAQLIHQSGRWRLVNLVSSNGIFVNGEKRLTAYLADGDRIKLGNAKLVFRAAVGAAVEPAVGSVPNGAAASQPESGKSRGMLIAAVAAVVIAAAGAALLFL
jgi:pSer/pThr/pTyr-binding forkhead associated (FHA) protein